MGERERTLASASASLWVKFLWKFGSLLASEGGYRQGLAGGTKFNVKTIHFKFPKGICESEIGIWESYFPFKGQAHTPSQAHLPLPTGTLAYLLP